MTNLQHVAPPPVSPRRVLLVVPGFGPPSLDLKRRILNSNVARLREVDTVDIRVFNYGTEPCGLDCKEEMAPGWIGQFLYNKLPPSEVEGYDYVLLLLDDIELQPSFNLNHFIQLYEKYNFDILSPTLTQTSEHSWTCMLQRGADIRDAYYAELFCYLMKPAAYARYHALLDDKSKYLWGLDLALHLHGFRIGLVDFMGMHHHLYRASYSPENASGSDSNEEWAATRARLGNIDISDMDRVIQTLTP